MDNYGQSYGCRDLLSSSSDQVAILPDLALQAGGPPGGIPGAWLSVMTTPECSCLLPTGGHILRYKLQGSSSPTGGKTATNVAAFFGAAAAFAAALFSGVSLYLTGKREERRWRRDALFKIYQRFIELSFERSLKAVLGIKVRRGTPPFDLEELADEEWLLHQEYDGLLTSLRLLGVSEMVHAAETLHKRDQELVVLALRSEEAVTDIDFETFERKREENRQAKQSMLDAARASLALDAAAPIDDIFWGRANE